MHIRIAVLSASGQRDHMINVKVTVYRLVADSTDALIAFKDRLGVNILNELVELASLTSSRVPTGYLRMGFAV